MAHDVQDRRRLEQLLLRYLVENPAAADSFEGVRLWWLRDAGTVNRAVLETVLNELVEKRWLIVRGEKAGTQIYSLNNNLTGEEADSVRRFAARETEESKSNG